MLEKYWFLIVGAAGIALFVLTELRRERKKNAQPIYEVKATIISLRLGSRGARGGGFGHYTMGSCYADFELEDGTRVELTAPAKLCENPVGTKGLLIYQGTKCEKFTPEQ